MSAPAGERLVLCRCERVTLGDLEHAAASLEMTSLRDLKLWTRAGMGICQGRVCRTLLVATADRLGLGRDAEDLRVRPPLRPVRLGALWGGGDEA